jgi:hypothetical protein
MLHYRITFLYIALVLVLGHLDGCILPEGLLLPAVFPGEPELQYQGRHE